MKKTLLTILLLFIALSFPSSLFSSADLDGTDDQITIDDAASLTPSATLSVFCWISPDDITNFPCGFKYDSGAGQRSWSMGTNASDQLQVTLSSTAAPFNGVQSRETNASMTDGNKYHVGFVFDGGPNTLLIYINGASQALTVNIGSVPNTLADNTEPLYIGRDSSPAYANGKITDVKLWNVALTTAQVLQEYNAKLKDKDFNVGASIQMYLPLDDQPAGTAGNGETARDLSGNGNNGTLDDGANNTGMTWEGETILSYPSQILTGQ